MESAAATRLPSLLSSYHSLWPDVNLAFSIGTSGSLIDDVIYGRLDCAFVAIAHGETCASSNFALNARGLQHTHAYTEELLLVVPPNHSPVTRPEDLKLATFAVFAPGCTYRNVLERWLGQSERPPGDWHAMEQASYHAILASVAAGSCFALCPRSILDLQCDPMDVRTHAIAAIDTHLVSRASYDSAAFDALRHLVIPDRTALARTTGRQDKDRSDSNKENIYFAGCAIGFAPCRGDARHPAPSLTYRVRT